MNSLEFIDREIKQLEERKEGEILDHVLRIKKGALDHDEYRKLKKVGFK